MSDEIPEISFEDELDADLTAQASLERDFVIVPILINGKIRKLRFTEMDGLEWADLCDRNPPRSGVKIDEGFGYNVTGSATQAAALSGQIQSGDEWKELSPEHWKRLIRALPGAQLRAVAAAVFQLNQFGPAMAVVDARKASAVESAMNSYSPALSESPAAD